MKFTVTQATEDDALEIASLRNAAAMNLTHKFGQGHWTDNVTERGVRYGLKFSRILIARNNDGVIATLRLSTKKPWSIDISYFTPVRKALYLLDMAVHPRLQNKGIGRQLAEEAKTVAKGWPADAIRLDAYDAQAGAGDFYKKCGFNETGRVIYRKVPLIYFELLL